MFFQVFLIDRQLGRGHRIAHGYGRDLGRGSDGVDFRSIARSGVMLDFFAMAMASLHIMDDFEFGAPVTGFSVRSALFAGTSRHVHVDDDQDEVMRSRQRRIWLP